MQIVSTKSRASTPSRYSFLSDPEITRAFVSGFAAIDLSYTKLGYLTAGATLTWGLSTFGAKIIASRNIPALALTVGSYGLAALFMGLDLREMARSSESLLDSARYFCADPSIAHAYALGNAFQGFILTSAALLPAIKSVRLASKPHILRSADNSRPTYPGLPEGKWYDDGGRIDPWGEYHPPRSVRPSPVSERPPSNAPKKIDPPGPKQEY